MSECIRTVWLQLREAELAYPIELASSVKNRSPFLFLRERLRALVLVFSIGSIILRDVH